MQPSIRKISSAFTLIEMLIVIIVIGILAVALIPKLIGAQDRARDGARAIKVGQIATAIDLYKEDKGSYPIASSLYSSIPSNKIIVDSTPFRYNLKQLFSFAPSVFAAGRFSTVAMVANQIDGYVSSIPTDPGKGIAATDDKNATCMLTGDSFGYYTDSGGNMYAVTSLMESKKGNTTNCFGVIDSNNNAGYNVVGKGLQYNSAATSQSTPESQWTPASCFSFSNGSITSYNDSCAKDVVIPEKINNITVTTIGNWAFYGKSLTSVILPNTIHTIGGAAFNNNNLNSIDIPNSVIDIGDWAFANNKFKFIKIPEGTIHIGDQSFYNNIIKNVIIPYSIENMGGESFTNNGPNSNSSNIPYTNAQSAHGTRIYNGTNWIRPS